ncbi:MAG: GNAT family N-acetyltransferase [Thermoplasmata archaeon]|nr:GNAT family N-acetyltransferase [Thermoplasmata archaeon]
MTEEHVEHFIDQRRKEDAIAPFINPFGLFGFVFRKEFTAKDGTTVIFREPTIADAEALMRFINSVIREDRSGIVMDRPVTLKEESEWLKARLGEIRRRTTVLLVAEVDGKIVGNCDISRRMWKESHRAVIGVVLAKAVRMIGIGKAIMTACIELAKERISGLETIELSVLDYNKSARTLYEQLGFAEICRVPNAMKEGSEYIDESIMALNVKGKGRGKCKQQSQPIAILTVEAGTACEKVISRT